MKKSSFVHGISIVTGIWSVLALLAAWIAGEAGTAFGFSQSRLFNDAIILQLIAISAGVCALYRRQLEHGETSMCGSHVGAAKGIGTVALEQPETKNAGQHSSCCQ